MATAVGHCSTCNGYCSNGFLNGLWKMDNCSACSAWLTAHTYAHYDENRASPRIREMLVSLLTGRMWTRNELGQSASDGHNDLGQTGVRGLMHLVAEATGDHLFCNWSDGDVTMLQPTMMTGGYSIGPSEIRTCAQRPTWTHDWSPSKGSGMICGSLQHNDSYRMYYCDGDEVIHFGPNTTGGLRQGWETESVSDFKAKCEREELFIVRIIVLRHPPTMNPQFCAEVWRILYNQAQRERAWQAKDGDSGGGFRRVWRANDGGSRGRCDAMGGTDSGASMLRQAWQKRRYSLKLLTKPGMCGLQVKLPQWRGAKKKTGATTAPKKTTTMTAAARTATAAAAAATARQRTQPRDCLAKLVQGLQQKRREKQWVDWSTAVNGQRKGEDDEAKVQWNDMLQDYRQRVSQKPHQRRLMALEAQLRVVRHEADRRPVGHDAQAASLWEVVRLRQCLVAVDHRAANGAWVPSSSAPQIVKDAVHECGILWNHAEWHLRWPDLQAPSAVDRRAMLAVAGASPQEEGVSVDKAGDGETGNDYNAVDAAMQRAKEAAQAAYGRWKREVHKRQQAAVSEAKRENLKQYKRKMKKQQREQQRKSKHHQNPQAMAARIVQVVVENQRQKDAEIVTAAQAQKVLEEKHGWSK